MLDVEVEGRLLMTFAGSSFAHASSHARFLVGRGGG
jgi:hypothetical protein